MLVALITGLSLAPGRPAHARALLDPLLRDLAKPQAAAGAGAAAQAHPRQSAATETVQGREWVDVWLQGTVSRGQIESLDGSVGTVAGNVMSARIPADKLEQLLDVGGLERVQAAQGVRFQSDLSVPAINAPAMWGGVAPNYPSSGKTGKHVVVGIVDTGLDLTHFDFLKVAGNQTRVRWLWDQTAWQQPAPAGFGYGTEFSGAAIDSGKCSAQDYTGHGTGMAGVAAASGRATGNGKPAYEYVGVAPEADLVIVELHYYTDGTVPDSRVIDGVNYVFQKAAALNEPAVVLVAANKCTGPHDGHDPMDEAISALTGPGKVVVASAGNYGSQSKHAEWTSTGTGQGMDVTLNFGSYMPSPYGSDFLAVESWYDAGVSYSVSVVAPGGQVIGPIARGASTQTQTPSGLVTINNGMYTSDNGSYRVDLQVHRGNTSQPVIPSGTWTFRFSSQTTGTHRVDLWLTGCSLGSATPVFVQGKTEARLVGSPATANGVISAGAYTTKAAWTALDGYGYSLADATVGDLATFSSPGPRRDGVQVPSLAAPGYAVSASRAAGYFPSVSWFMPDSVHCITTGTSSAAAHVAGAVALMLQDSTSLTGARAWSTLQQEAVVDGWTGPVPNDRWGYGKLHLQPGLAAGVAGGPDVSFALRAISPNPSRGPMKFEFALSSEDLRAAGGWVRLRILDVGGRQVSELRTRAYPGEGSLSWPGLGSDGRPVASGIYLARLELGSRHSVRKFMRMD